MSVSFSCGLASRSAPGITLAPTCYPLINQIVPGMIRLGRVGKGSRILCTPYWRNLYGLQIGRIWTKNKTRFRKLESKPANLEKIPLSDHSSDGKFRVCQARQQEERGSERTHRNQRTRQNKRGSLLTVPPEISVIQQSVSYTHLTLPTKRIV